MTKAIVTDIEGTTSSLSFVKDVLFPYSREHLAEFVRRFCDEPAVRAQLDAVRGLVTGVANDDQIVNQLLQWIDEDRKVTPLKALQGMIWEDGYRQGRFRGHIYEDAARRLRVWHDGGMRLYVYSSGSVQAQKLLFAHTTCGDLTPLFSGYFDTRIGGKREARSYEYIAREIGLPPGDALFLSDVKEELDAARAAGMQTRQLLREGAGDPGDHPTAVSFDDFAP
jgi:enolase-phosphatase E1